MNRDGKKRTGANIYDYDTEIIDAKCAYFLRGGVLVKCICQDQVARIPDAVTVIGEHALAAGYSAAMEHIEIPSTVTTICESAMQGSRIEDLVVPDSVLMLGEGAFCCNSRLKTVKLSANVRVIPCKLFFGCTALQEAVIPAGVTRIEAGAFQYCTSLQRVVIPRSVEEIAPFAFSHCDALAEAEFTQRQYVSVRLFYETEGRRVRVDNASSAAQYLKNIHADKIWKSSLRSMKTVLGRLQKA